MSNNYIINLTNKNFKKIVLQEEKPVFVDFWAEWCSPCKLLLPILEEIAIQYHENIIFTKVNVDHCSEIATKFEIQSIPTLLLFKNKQVISKNIGLISKNEIKKLITLHLNLE
ncbi:thioredoxin [Buchnera aphidicola]|uniref:thioredoxin n=1 Tax=Buchnera aphidicola TaxID=9 RepID=UPI003464304E